MHSVLEPLRHRPFRLLLSARVVSTLGNGVAPIALAFAVLDLTGSATQLGLVVGARSLANVLLLLFGGVLADRLPRQLVLVGSSVLAGVSQLAVTALVGTGAANVGWLAALSALNGAGAAFTFPASSALVSQTVPKSLLRQANALNRLGFNAALVVGASAGGALVAAFGPAWGLGVDAASFFLAATLFAGIAVPTPRTGTGAEGGTWAQLREGWTEFAARRWVWVVVAAFLFINAASTGGVQVLGPVVADTSIGRRAWGLVLGAQTAGLVLGGLLALRLHPRRALAFGMLSTLPFCLVLLTLGLSPRLPLLVGAALVAGVGVEQFGIAWETSLQEHIPADRLARVYSYDALGSFLAIPLGETVVGPIAGSVGLRPTLVGLAVITFVAGALPLADPQVRRLRRLEGSAPPDVQRGSYAAGVESTPGSMAAAVPTPSVVTDVWEVP